MRLCTSFSSALAKFLRILATNSADSGLGVNSGAGWTTFIPLPLQIMCPQVGGSSPGWMIDSSGVAINQRLQKFWTGADFSGDRSSLSQSYLDTLTSNP